MTEKCICCEEEDLDEAHQLCQSCRKHVTATHLQVDRRHVLAVMHACDINQMFDANRALRLHRQGMANHAKVVVNMKKAIAAAASAPMFGSQSEL